MTIRAVLGSDGVYQMIADAEGALARMSRDHPLRRLQHLPRLLERAARERRGRAEDDHSERGTRTDAGRAPVRPPARGLRLGRHVDAGRSLIAVP